VIPRGGVMMALGGPAIVLAIVLATTTARAGDRTSMLAADAERALRELRYEDAVGLAERAWQTGDADPAQLRDVFALAGRAAGSVGDEDAARLWFSRWLCLDPNAQLPGGTSPKLTALLAQARDALGGRSVTASAVRNEHETAIQIKADPLGLVVAVGIDDKRIKLTDGFTSYVGGSGNEITLLDRYGNVLATVTIQNFISPAKPALFARPSTWAVASGAFAVVGGVALYVALDAWQSIRDLNNESGMHQFAETRPLEQRFDRFQWIARVGFGASAAAAVVAAFAWSRQEHIVVAPTGSGGSVSWVQSF